MIRTKIVCTLGPASQTEDVLRPIITAGMTVARINFSHGDHATHTRNITLVRRLANELGRVVAVMVDLQGPKLRVGDIASPGATLREGATFTLTTRPVPGDDREVHLPHPQLVADLHPGERILLDDGMLELEVLDTTDTDVHCRVITGGLLTSHKGINLPETQLSLSSITDKDRHDLAFALEQRVDYVAQSFVRRAADVLALRNLLAEHNATVPIVAKIEKREAIDAFDDILAVSDGIMVARGDLGVEVPAEDVPLHQKMIIRKARAAGVPVITATQMLQSMIENPRPTRAEASDVANAILDGTDAVMLSGETAVGRYPVAAVETMARIANTIERSLPYEEWMHRGVLERATTATDAISQATCEIALELEAKAIITTTMSGHTARMVAKHRPRTPIVAVTPDPAVQRRLALVWGVESLLIPAVTHTDEMVYQAMEAIKKRGLVERGDLVILTAGVPLGGVGKTNMLQVRVVE